MDLLGTGGDLSHLPAIHIEDKKDHNTGGLARIVALLVVLYDLVV